MPVPRIVLAAVASAVVLAACGSSGSDQAATVEGVRTFSDLDAGHVEAAPSYPVSPPAGGDHFPVWLNCGVYADQQPDGFLVHALEHGAVLIAYDSGLDADSIQTLQAMGRMEEKVIVMPYAGLDEPIALRAWGVALDVGSVGDGRIEQFIEAYTDGDQAPEPGAPCSGGVGEPG